MNILDTIGIRLPCHSCGNTYRVPLRDVLLSHIILLEGCPVRQETECPPAFQSRLFERKDIEELQRSWHQLEQRARTDGGELVLMAGEASVEMQPTGRSKAVASSDRPSEASVPTTLAAGHAQERVGKPSEGTKKSRIRKQTHLKAKRGTNRRIG